MSTTSNTRKWLPWIIGAALVITTLGIILYVRYRKKKPDGAGIAETPKHQETAKPTGTAPNPGATNRGLKNNNPGNIHITSQSWKGKIPKTLNTDGSFEQFTEKHWGVRAMTRIIKNWI